MNLEDLLTTVSLSAEVSKLPAAPGRIGAMGLFKDKGVATTAAAIDFKNGVLSLVPNTARAADPSTPTLSTRDVKTLSATHLALQSTLLPDAVQDLRAFGAESTDAGLSAPAQVISDRLAEMKTALETTREYHRLGAIKGKVLDADGVTTIYNLFSLFGITQSAAVGNVVNFDVSTATKELLPTAQKVRRYVEKNTPGLSLGGVRALASPGFMDALLANPSVREAYRVYQSQVDARAAFTDPKAAALGNFSGGFFFGGVEFVEYGGSIGDTPFIAEGEAYAFPVADGAFACFNAPANYNEAVNTLGQPYYAKSEARPLGKGYLIEVQSNPLTLCLYPKALCKLGLTT
ncbi:minor capsid protein E [Betaproteobacteria bacterium]|nr:minor capsid protein E [Betaproteobacteria bacterium]GHU14861.1 minor capsid protein E [Betaproteobacteria bacterium]